ncbi:MAG: alpha-mannosidase, partial [Gemmatimonadetes bacterium]|nr:alpha-mannosidase [Gemmatimonadota bacterium]
MSQGTPNHTVHLLCNSHLDPVWLWEWPEGAGEALALARTVCDLCEEFDSFVFNRNEVQFYEWIEEYDPALFERIGRLVGSGQWHVMGGWYLQPDCNLPSGESFVRQILTGKRYFRDKFGVEPTTGANLDSFGHSRGLVQILAKSGYDSYLFCRPKLDEAPLPAAEFTWVG